MKTKPVESKAYVVSSLWGGEPLLYEYVMSETSHAVRVVSGDKSGVGHRTVFPAERSPFSTTPKEAWLRYVEEVEARLESLHETIRQRREYLAQARTALAKLPE